MVVFDAVAVKLGASVETRETLISNPEAGLAEVDVPAARTTSMILSVPTVIGSKSAAVPGVFEVDNGEGRIVLDSFSLFSFCWWMEGCALLILKHILF